MSQDPLTLNILLEAAAAEILAKFGYSNAKDA